MTMKNNGYVGIGTSTPTYKLVVGGDVDYSSGIGTNAIFVQDANYPAVVVGVDNQNYGYIKWDVSGGYLSIATKENYANQDNTLIIKTGNVGIGTTGPKAKLEVAASVNGNPVTSGSSQTNGALRVRGSATNVLDIGQQSASPYAMWMQVCESTSLGVSYPLVINPNGGNVGIGTTSPTGNLTVESAGNQFHIRANTATAGEYWNFDVTSNNQLYIINSAGTGYLTIKDDGNVGIGLTNPTDKLVVAGNISIPGAHKIYNGSAADSAGLTFPSNVFRIDGFSGITFNSSTTNIGSQTERMRITNTGNVGIGTASPTSKLDITNGEGKFCVDSKTHGLTNAFTTCLTVNLNSHTGCYVTLTCFGDWGSHSAAAYRGEFFLQNGANGYNEPGIILRQDDNTSVGTDQIVCQILDPTSGANPKDFEIQIRTTATTGTTSFTGQLTYTVQGKFNSIT
jgi:hypothetical protein